MLSSLSLEKAAARLAGIQHSTESVKNTPIGLLATTLIHERLLKHASVLFVRTVLPDRSPNDTEVYAKQDDMEEEQRKETIDAGKSLGGRTKELADALDKVWTTGVNNVSDFMDDEDIQDDGVESEIRSILMALILYRRIFPSSILSCASASGVTFILSPPPSPSRKNSGLHLALRRVLASDAFDFKGEGAEDEKMSEDHQLGVILEDARDHVVDMLVEGERAGRSRALKCC